MSKLNMAALLDEVQTAYLLGLPLQSITPQMKKLAQASYAPALPFFLDRLADRQQEWRWQCLLFVGLHYDLTGNEAALDKLRDMVRVDSDRQIRMRAADLLTLHSSWPDYALIDAMENEQETAVSHAIFKACLELAGVPRMAIKDEMAQLYINRTTPTLADINLAIQNARQSRIHREPFRGQYE